MKRYRIGLVVFLLLVLLIATIFLAQSSILVYLGRNLQARTQNFPPPWDAIIVLSGRPYERSFRAAELYCVYPTTVVALGGGHNDDLLAIGMAPAQECAFTQLALRSLCIPDTAILTECVGTSTMEEILHIRALCRERGWKRIVIVSSPFHGRRIERLANRWLSEQGIQWGVAAALPLQYRLEEWWRSEAGILTVFEEYAKTAYYWHKGYF
ncbi:MAG: YdcF family protein [Bacteroidia bacterium]|nr:YdcF family protein [Bacteroidia bacterium]MCX7652028.1 YdcF family protein [Bacteroidia bacterium]MDW8416301.1 YdcF family protein [Bacteroidia bacterium]